MSGSQADLYQAPIGTKLSAPDGSLPWTTVDALYAAGKDILARYGTQSVITMGADGALAVLENASYRIPPIQVEVSSPAGAGDAVLAGLAHALHFGEEIEAGLRLGIAAATAVCLQAGTAAYDVADMRRLLDEVELVALD